MHICQKIVIICNSEEISLVSNNNLVIYIGTHGCEIALFADTISGSPALPEHKSINIISNGTIIKTNICYISPLSDITDISNYSLLNYNTIYSKPLFLINHYKLNLILQEEHLIQGNLHRNSAINSSRSFALLDHPRECIEYNWLL